jgi:hypothetical protein
LTTGETTMNNQDEKQYKPVQPPKKEVWMKCRASEGCEGNKAYIALQRRNPIQQGGGVSYRYRCTTCNGVWHITV